MEQVKESSNKSEIPPLSSQLLVPNKEIIKNEDNSSEKIKNDEIKHEKNVSNWTGFAGHKDNY